MRICFIGGGNPSAGELDDVMNHLNQYIKLESKVLVIAFATDESKIDRWFNTAKKSFKDIGVENITLLDYLLPNQEMKYLIKESDVIYFTGGKPEKLMKRLIEKEIIETLRSFSGFIVGVSAGALALCNDCIITKDEDYLETSIIKGIGLVDFSVEAHYDETIDEELVPFSDKRNIYAIPNGSGLFWNGRVLTSINSVFHFHKNKKEKID